METFETMRQEVEVTLRDLLAARPALMAAVETATRVAFEAAKSLENFSLRVARGTRHGADELVPAVARLLDQARRQRDRANAALTRVQRELKNVDWTIELKRAEIAQLELVANPPVEGRGSPLEVVKRKPPAGFDVVGDNIEFPPRIPRHEHGAVALLVDGGVCGRRLGPGAWLPALSCRSAGSRPFKEARAVFAILRTR